MQHQESFQRTQHHLQFFLSQLLIELKIKTKILVL